MTKGMLFLYTLLMVGNQFNASLEYLNATEYSPPGDFTVSMTKDVIRHILQGPLKGKEVALLAEKDTLTDRLLVNDIMPSLTQPTTLLLYPKTLMERNINKSQMNESGANNTTRQDNGIGSVHLAPSSFLIIISSGDDLWWPFHTSPDIVKGIVLITPWVSCLAKNFFKTPLLSMTPFVVLVCPYRGQGLGGSRSKNQGLGGSRPSFKVWTWKPYVSGTQAVQLGPWNPDSYTSWNSLFKDRFGDMSQKNMSIYVNPEGIPFVYNAKDGSVTGISYVIIKTISSYLKFNLNITSSRLYLWDFMFASVKSGKSEMFINYAPMTPQRYQEYDLLRPYHREGYGMILRNPPPLPRWKNVIYPFTWTVWMAVAISMACTSVTYHFLYYKHEKSFFNNALSVLQCMLSNSMASVPTWWRIRSFLLVWWIVSWVLQLSYTCNLIAVLTIPVFPNWIQTAGEIVENKRRLCMLDYGSYIPETMNASDHPVLSQLGQTLTRAPMVYENLYGGAEKCVSLVLNRTHAHIEAYSFIKLMYKNLGYGSTVYSLSEQLYHGYLVFLAKKHSPWSYKIDRSIQRLIETGLIKKWYQDAMLDSTRQIDTKISSELQPLSMHHLQGSFYMMVGGMVISILALVTEIL